MSDDNKEFSLFEPFDIDNGELDGLSQQQIFVLGYELSTIATKGDLPSSFNSPVHANNVDRIRKALVRRNRVFSIKPMPDDKSEDWWWLEIEAQQ